MLSDGGNVDEVSRLATDNGWLDARGQLTAGGNQLARALLQQSGTRTIFRVLWVFALPLQSVIHLCVPKIRCCNIDGEGRQGQVVRRRRRGAQSRDGEGRPCSEIDGSSTHYNRRHIRGGSGGGPLRQPGSCGRDIRGGSSR